MTALVFPASPTVGQVYSANNRSWAWDGTTWNIVSGASAAPSFIGCRAYNAGTQSIATGTIVKVTFNTESFDTGGLHSTSSDTSRFTATVAGYYQATATIAFSNNSTALRQVWWMKNNADFSGNGTLSVPAVSGAETVLSAIAPAVYLNPGDYLEVAAYQTSGSTLTLGHASNANMSTASVTKIDGIVGPAGTVANGTAFPASPTTNQRFFRTDLGLDCYYDGTRWLTVNEYAAPFVTNGAVDVYPLTANAGGVGAVVCDNSQSGIYIERIICNTYVATTNNGSHYWTIQAFSENAAGTPTNVGSSFNTSADTVNNNVAHVVTVAATVATTQRSISFSATKSGSPGNIYPLPAALVYRLIVT